MTKKRRTAIHGAPLTTAEASSIPKARKPVKIIVCSVCGKAEGTLIRIEAGVWKHNNC